jgi:hypothetical protein
MADNALPTHPKHLESNVSYEDSVDADEVDLIDYH